MRREVAVALALLATACGPAATTYQVDLVARERCTTRADVETCDSAVARARQTATLIVENRADVVLLFLDQTLLVSTATVDPLDGRRRDEQRDLETGCVRGTERRLLVERHFDEISGTFIWSERIDGPAASCGQTPFGDRGVDDLTGLRVEGP